jgi:hypothetical protein
MTPARRFMAARAIDPRVAHQAGVTLVDGNRLVYPNGRWRQLPAEGTKTMQPKGKPLCAWWWRTPNGMGTVLVCEGETDALAALTVLAHTPEVVGLWELPIISIPGTGFPVHRLTTALKPWKAVHSALLALDADEAGRTFAANASRELVDSGIRPILVELPEGSDLAGWLAGMEEERRGEALAGLLVDSEGAAPSLEAFQRDVEIDRLEARLEELRAAT